MTALTQYQRLEATGIWRKSAEAQRIDVIISIGESSLVITDINEKPLAHWSLAALAVKPVSYTHLTLPTKRIV